MRKHIAPLMILSVMAISPAVMSNAFSQEAFNTDNNKALDLAGDLGVEVAEGTDPSVMVSQANVYFVGTNGLRVRSTPEDAGKTMGLLSLNEKVRVVTGELINGKYVEVQILGTVNPMTKADKYYVVREYLTEKMVDYKEFTGKYYVVVNVATETLRIYERQCLDNSCPSKMIMETEVVVGEDKDLPKEEKGKGRSILGSYRVTGWAKFYQDAGGHYPAWYRDGYPGLPEVGAGFNKWFKNKFMPIDPATGKEVGAMRGAFGWYAAFVAPNPFGQWTHGTIGWGEDKDEYIKKTKKFVTNVVSNPRSSGCTRNNNEAIAFIRQLVDTGTPIVKIYAKEALLDSSLAGYGTPKKWQYILTKKAGQKSDRAEVLASLGVTGAEADMYWAAKRNGNEMIVDPKSPLNQILEVGTYDLDTVPTPIAYTPGEKMGKLKASVGRKGNVYGIDTKDMSSGVYYVDAGMLSDYHHPKTKLDMSGFEDEETPPWMDVATLNR